MRTELTSGMWIEAVTTLAAALLMTVAGYATLEDDAATAVVTVSAPVRVLDVAGTPDAPVPVAMPHVDASRG